MPQLRTAKDRWYGNCVAETINTPTIRGIHPEEAALYLFQCDSALNLRLPYDTSGECLGVFCRVVNDNQGGGGMTLVIVTFDDTPVATVAPGESAIICLTLNVGLGTWLVLKSDDAFTGRTPL